MSRPTWQRQTTIAPARALFVGDRLHNDVEGAQGVGMTAVHMVPPHLAGRVDATILDVTPDHTIRALAELEAILAGYGGPERAPEPAPAPGGERAAVAPS